MSDSSTTGRSVVTATRSLALTVLAGLAALALAAPAGAAADPLAGGQTTFKLRAGAADALADAGVRVVPVGRASVGHGGIEFPIVGGRLAAGAARGQIFHAGGLRLERRGDALEVRRFLIKLGTRPRLTAKVGGDRVTILRLDTSDANVSRKGFATVIQRVRADLTRAATTAINETFGRKLVEPGFRLGRARTKADPATVGLRQRGATKLAVDQGAADLLASAGITPSPIAPSSATNDGRLRFPITGGRLSPADLTGTIRHGGGLRLSGGGTDVDLRRFTIRVDDRPNLTAVVGGDRVSILFLDLSGANVDVKGRRIAVRGVEALLTGAGARALNDAFDTSAFERGQLLGTTTTRAFAR